MVFGVLCSCTMWSRIRKKVQPKSRSYDLQQSSQLHDLEDEDDLEDPESPCRENRRTTNGFAKCLIPHLSNNPISCACKRNDSPIDAPISEKPTEKPKNSMKDSKRGHDDKIKSDKSNSLTIGQCLNYYFKENDSCELVRKNKSTSSTLQPKVQKQSKVNNELDNKKHDSNVLRSTSMKDKNQSLPLFSAGQRDIKSGIDFKEFQRVFDNSRESIADACKTVTFETFGKPVNQEVKPPMFLPIKKKHVTEDLLDPSICESSLLDGSLSSSKGASLTSEEGVESGYGTQEDGPDRLARSISSSSESNAQDFISDIGKIKCQISRESTGEEDVFHHFSSGQPDKTIGQIKVSSVADHTTPIILARHFKPLDTQRVNRNMNIVVAEVHAENFDEPRPCGSKSPLSNQSLTNQNTQKHSPKMVDRQDNNSANDLLSGGLMDINCNPKDREKTVVTSKPIDQTKPVSSQASSRNSNSPRQLSSIGQSPVSPQAPETDSDEEDIREYLPADIHSMSEVFNSSLSIGADGLRSVAELYASVPRQPETEQVIETMTTPPAQTIKLPLTKLVKKESVTLLTEKRPSRPDVIDCHDRTPTPPLPPPPDDLLLVSESSDNEGTSADQGEENIVISDDGDSGPPLPSRNYSDTLTKDSQLTKEEKKFCEAPTLVFRQKSKDKSPTETSPSSSTSESACHQVAAAEDEIVQQEEPIHMTWEEVMKEAKSLGIPLSPPTVTQKLERRSSTSSQSSSCTPIASPIATKRTVKVKRSQSECKKRSPFKEKLQNFFTLRKSKVDVAKTLSNETKERYHNRCSIPSVSSYDRGYSTTQRDHTTHVIKPCMCTSGTTTRSAPQRITSPQHYNTYHSHRNQHHCGTHYGHAPSQSRNHMNVSINVSVISSSTNIDGNSPEVSLMTQSMDASLGGMPAVCPGSPMSRSMIEGACCSSQGMIDSGCYPTTPIFETGHSPGSPMSRSLMCNSDAAHSMSNQSLSQQSILSGHSAPSYYRSHSTNSQLDNHYHSSQSTCSQSAHSYQSAHSIGSPTAAPRRSTPTKGGTTSPMNGSPLNEVTGHYGTNGYNSHYGTNGINGINNHYGTNSINGLYGTNTITNHYGTNGMTSYGTNGTITNASNGCYGTGYDSTTGNYGSGGEGGINADFISSLLKLKDCGWYWGPLGWDDAESKLSNKADGSFLVRDSSDDRYILSLSFRSQGTTHHTRIEHYKGMFSFYSQPKSHGAATIVEFIEKAMEHSRNGKFLYFLRPRAPGLPPAPVQLLYPVSRLQNMQSLQHMCRFVILKQVRKDHIDRLPIPPRLKEYLKQNQYYTEYLGGDGTEYPRY